MDTLTTDQAIEILRLAHAYADARVDFLRGKATSLDAATEALSGYVLNLATPHRKADL